MYPEIEYPERKAPVEVEVAFSRPPLNFFFMISCRPAMARSLQCIFLSSLSQLEIVRLLLLAFHPEEALLSESWIGKIGPMDGVVDRKYKAKLWRPGAELVFLLLVRERYY
jgi:hypothetical protein